MFLFNIEQQIRGLNQRSVAEDIDAQATYMMENFQSPTVVELGRIEYKRLLGDCYGKFANANSLTGATMVTYNTQAGPLRVILMPDESRLVVR